MHIRRSEKLSRCDIRQRKNLDFGLCMLYLCIREVRLHLSIAFESQLSSLCVRFALTLHSRSQAAPQQNFRKQVFKFCIRLALTLHSRSQAAPQQNFRKTSFQVLHSVGTDIAYGEVRLHLSIAFESQLSSLCVRFALTLHSQ